jgi:hypothetical protein
VSCRSKWHFITWPVCAALPPERPNLAGEFAAPGRRCGVDYRDCITHRHRVVLPLHTRYGGKPLRKIRRSTGGRIELASASTNAGAFERMRHPAVARSAGPRQICGLIVCFFAIDMGDLDITAAPAKAADFRAQRRVRIGAIAQGAVCHRFLAPFAAGWRQSKSESSSSISSSVSVSSPASPANMSRALLIASTRSARVASGV